MPIMQDSAKPIKIVDTSNKITHTDTKGAAAIKTVDSSGRFYAPPAKEAKDATKVDVTDTSKAMNEAMQGTKHVEPAKEDKPVNQEAEARKLFLDAQKAERKAKEMEKKAKAGLDKATAIEKAIEMSKTGGDPTALLVAAGLDPIKFYQEMTAYAIKTPAKQETPEQKQLREHQERLDKYAEDLKVQSDTIKQKEDLAAKNQIISSQVIPLLQNKAEKYEALFAEYGANAAVEVFQAVWTRYQETGELVPFEDAADRMEKYWSDQIESGLNAASKLKKFSQRFAQAGTTSSQSNGNNSKSNVSSFTLSNQQQVSSSATSAGKKPGETWDERTNRILKKYGV